MAIFGVGTDIIEIKRIKETLTRYEKRFLTKVFHPIEIKYSFKGASPEKSLAVRFAFKEALGKAMGSGIGAQFHWQDAWIENQDNGRPQACVSHRLQQILDNKSLTIHVSLSHNDETAQAFVIIEKR